MKVKAILVTLLVLAAFAAIKAQSADIGRFNYVRPQLQSVSNTSPVILSLGLGFNGYYPSTAPYYIENPNLTLIAEKSIFNHIGPGHIDLEALVSYKSIYSGYTDSYTNYTYEQRWDYYIFGPRLSYHLNPVGRRKIDMYAGIMEAYYISSFKFSSDDPNYAEPNDPGYSLKYSNTTNFFAPTVFLGIRSWITNHSSVWMEIGYGYTSISFGASYKL